RPLPDLQPARSARLALAAQVRADCLRGAAPTATRTRALARQLGADGVAFFAQAAASCPYPEEEAASAVDAPPPPACAALDALAALAQDDPAGAAAAALEERRRDPGASPELARGALARLRRPPR